MNRAKRTALIGGVTSAAVAVVYLIPRQGAATGALIAAAIGLVVAVVVLVAMAPRASSG